MNKNNWICRFEKKKKKKIVSEPAPVLHIEKKAI